MQPLSAKAIFDELDAYGLQSGSIFGAISREAIRFLVENGKVYSVRQHEEIFRSGDPGGSFFVVCRGSVDFFKHHQGKYAYTRTSMPGEEVGFVAMIALHDHVGKAVAHEDSIVLEISSELFADLHEKYPFDFGIMTLNLARDLARIVRKLSNILVEHAIDH
ncbi:cyclic nucleotide-binding domain-containing protein [Marinobacterium aestuariivivens]|uniref:Cyclic nucleotide-binding domain-containing protein n=1 Tax=Marinobacterium aestuariivivens TaxID=1698799 RepID=A0ABW2A718_9GAMM